MFILKEDKKNFFSIFSKRWIQCNISVFVLAREYLIHRLIYTLFTVNCSCKMLEASVVKRFVEDHMALWICITL